MKGCHKVAFFVLRCLTSFGMTGLNEEDKKRNGKIAPQFFHFFIPFPKIASFRSRAKRGKKSL